MQADTRIIAKALLADPDIVADIFRLVAESGQIMGSARAAQKYSELNLTQYSIRQLLHRRPPFENSIIFSKVNPEDEADVTARFKYGRKSPKKSNVQARRPDIEAATQPSRVRQQTLDIPDDAAFLHELIDAKLAIEKARKRYEDALDNAEANGLHKATIRAFLSMLPETMARG